METGLTIALEISFVTLAVCWMKTNWEKKLHEIGILNSSFSIAAISIGGISLLGLAMF